MVLNLETVNYIVNYMRNMRMMVLHKGISQNPITWGKVSAALILVITQIAPGRVMR